MGEHDGLLSGPPNVLCMRLYKSLPCDTMLALGLAILEGSFPFTNISFSAPKPAHPAYPETISTIGDHLRTRRLDLGLLQKEVAQRIGVGTNTLILWELNYAAPKIQYLPEIIAFLGYSPLPVGESFSEKLKTYRLVNGLSQLKLARALGVNPTTVVKWEVETSQPKPEMREWVLGVIEQALERTFEV